MTVVFRLFRQVPTSQRFRSYTAWPNRAEGSFSQLFRSFDPKVRPGPTEPFVLLLKYTLFEGLCQAKSYFFIKIAFPRHVFRFSTAVTTVNLSSLKHYLSFFQYPDSILLITILFCLFHSLPHGLSRTRNVPFLCSKMYI